MLAVFRKRKNLYGNVWAHFLSLRLCAILLHISLSGLFISKAVNYHHLLSAHYFWKDLCISQYKKNRHPRVPKFLYVSNFNNCFNHWPYFSMLIFCSFFLHVYYVAESETIPSFVFFMFVCPSIKSSNLVEHKSRVTLDHRDLVGSKIGVKGHKIKHAEWHMYMYHLKAFFVVIITITAVISRHFSCIMVSITAALFSFPCH